jgi:hypothetical protein
MSCEVQNITIFKGKTFERILRWESPPFKYKAITGITQAGPAVVTAVGHDVPDGWRVAIVSVQGMREINAKNNPPRAPEFTRATVLTGNTLELNTINSSDFHAWTSGGYVQYLTPVDLAGYTARMQIRATKASTTILLELTTANGRITIDNTAKTITLTISAVDTAALTFLEGVYDLELISAGLVVTKLLEGSVFVEEEVTR